MAWLEPAMEDAWNEFQYTQRLSDAGADVSIADDYLAFAGQLVVPIVTAYVIAQAAGWVSDLKQGRVELMLACPLSWPQLVWQRVLAVLAGTAAITAAAVAGLVVAAAAVGIGVSVAGLARLAADTVLLAAALAAIAALVVAWLRSTAAVTVLAIFVAASYLLVLLTPMFAWPDWVTRASVFGAYGNPYLETPAWTGLAVLAVLAVVGGLSAASVARRSPKVAT
jgi:ABC-2 type transport system permease protein